MTATGASEPLSNLRGDIGLLNRQPPLGPSDRDYSACLSGGPRGSCALALARIGLRDVGHSAPMDETALLQDSMATTQEMLP